MRTDPELKNENVRMKIKNVGYIYTFKTSYQKTLFHTINQSQSIKTIYFRILHGSIHFYIYKRWKQKPFAKPFRKPSYCLLVFKIIELLSESLKVYP